MAQWWNAEVERIDRMLHADGVPDACRLRTVALFITAFSQAEKAKRDAEARRHRERQAAVLVRELGATRAAEVMGEPVRTVYWLRDQFYQHANCAMDAVPALQEPA